MPDPAPAGEPVVHDPFAWPTCSVYHASGLKVYMPIVAGTDYTAIAGVVDQMLASGWRVSPPGTEPGEEVEEIGSFVWREVDSKERPSGFCPKVDLYKTNVGTKWAVMSLYLNKPEQQAEFEAIAGVKLDTLPKYVGQGKLERGNRQTDHLIHKCRVFKIVIRDNPHYDPEKAEAAKAPRAAPYTVPKRVFVRFFDSPGPPASQQADPPPPASQAGGDWHDDKIYENLLAFCSTGPQIDVFNAYLKEYGILKLAPGPHRDRCGVVVKEFTTDRNWTWAPESKQYVAKDDGDIPF